MERISSGSARLGKTLFSVLWFGILGILFLLALVGRDTHGNHAVVAIIFPLVLAGVGFSIMKKTMDGVADEVLDAGDSLVVRFGHDLEYIQLSNIINVGYTPMAESSRVTLMLRTPSRFGAEISFYVKQRYVPFGKNPVIAELIQRIDAARLAAR